LFGTKKGSPRGRSEGEAEIVELHGKKKKPHVLKEREKSSNHRLPSGEKTLLHLQGEKRRGFTPTLAREKKRVHPVLASRKGGGGDMRVPSKEAGLLPAEE